MLQFHPRLFFSRAISEGNTKAAIKSTVKQGKCSKLVEENGRNTDLYFWIILNSWQVNILGLYQHVKNVNTFINVITVILVINVLIREFYTFNQNYHKRPVGGNGTQYMDVVFLITRRWCDLIQQNLFEKCHEDSFSMNLLYNHIFGYTFM